jgi:hypothetical protein
LCWCVVLLCCVVLCCAGVLLCCVVVCRYIIWSAMPVEALSTVFYVCMYVCMGGESAARSTLCIESVQACQYSGGVRTGDVGVAIGQLQEDRDKTLSGRAVGQLRWNSGSEDVIISWHSAWLKYSPASHYDSVDSSVYYLSRFCCVIGKLKHFACDSFQRVHINWDSVRRRNLG